MNELKKAKNILKKYNQEHLLYFNDKLYNNEKEILLNQILKIDFKQILDLYEASKTDEIINYEDIQPLKYIDKNELSNVDLINYSDVGEAYIKKRLSCSCYSCRWPGITSWIQRT